MDDDFDLRNFSRLCRLFPLPNVVMFPHAVLPLHIFEPRYRQMTEDALADDKLVTVVQLRRPDWGTANTVGDPPVEKVGCLGRILQHERLADGRFNFLLLGRKRVKLKREVASEAPYRVAEAEFLEDVEVEGPVEPRRAELIAMFRRAFEHRQALAPDLAGLLEDDLPMGVLTDIVAHALGLPVGLKQLLLNDPHVDHRADVLLRFLRQLADRDAGPAPELKPFPPPFSAN